MESLAILEREVDDGTKKLIRDYVDPWLLFGSKGVDVARTDGRRISLRGVEYEGEPRLAFWDAAYVDRHVVNFIDDMVAAVVKNARERGYDTGVALNDLKGMLQGAVNRIFDRMAVVDQRLRGKGFPRDVPKASVQDRVELLSIVLTNRIEAEFALEKIQARTIMMQSGAKASALVDSFSTWLMAAVSAFALFLVANHEKVKGFLPDALIWWGLRALVAVLVLGLLQKAAAVIVAAAGAGDLVGRDLADRGEVASGFSVVSQEVLRGVLPPFRPYVRRSLNRTAGGDFAQQGRAVHKLAQCQSIAMVLQLLIVVAMVIAASWSTLSPNRNDDSTGRSFPGSDPERAPSSSAPGTGVLAPEAEPKRRVAPEISPVEERKTNGSTGVVRKNERP